MDDRTGRVVLMFGTAMNLLLCWTEVVEMGVLGNRFPPSSVYASLIRLLM